MEGTEIFIPQLALRYDLWVVTARQDGCRHVVENLCKKFFSRSIVGMHFVWKRVAPMQFSENASKKQFIASTRGEKIAFLDDNPNEVRNIEGLVPSYLLDPHQFHKKEHSIEHCVKSWAEFAELML